MATVGAVCNMQTNQLYLTLINPDFYYYPLRVVKPQTPNNRVNTGFIAACHCDFEDEYETEYSGSIDSRTPPSIDIAIHQPIDNHPGESIDSSPGNENFALPEHCYPSFAVSTQSQKSIDYHHGETISRQGDYSIGSWADESHHESFAVDTALSEMQSDEYDENSHIEKNIEYHGLAMDDRGLLHTLLAYATSTSIDSDIQPWIDVHHTPDSKLQVKDNTDYGYLTSDEFGIFRDPVSQARAMDVRILHISKEDIAEIIAMNGSSNFFNPKNRSEDPPSIDSVAATSSTVTLNADKAHFNRLGKENLVGRTQRHPYRPCQSKTATTKKKLMC
ncbi:hypothetical protein YC2023_117376 [Brassica napus]